MRKELYYNPPFVTIRADADSDYFRPSATGIYLDDVEIRADMEKLEIEAISRSSRGFIFSSSAHFNMEEAINNAYNESAERINLSCWWAFRGSLLSRVDPRISLGLSNENMFETRTALLSTYGNIGHCAITLIQSSEYPYYVLGSSFSQSAKEASEKSYFESVNSWVGTKWSVNKGRKVSWDTEELARRWCEITDLETVDYPLPFKTNNETMPEIKRLLSDFELHTVKISVGFVALLSYERYLRSYEVAKLFEANKDVEVYSTPNN